MVEFAIYLKVSYDKNHIGNGDKCNRRQEVRIAKRDLKANKQWV
jgi:hypothetical protein